MSGVHAGTLLALVPVTTGMERKDTMNARLKAQRTREFWPAGPLPSKLAGMELDDKDLERRALELGNVLQSTLDLEQVVALFSSELARIVPHDGVAFLGDADGIEVRHGRTGAHACDYEIVLTSKALGRIVLWRDIEFTETETRALEALICALLYPLRNAMLYQRALATAHTDPVTGINNRAAMNAALARDVDLAHRHHDPLSLIMIDIDRFKQINDEHGHLLGDEVLKRVAAGLADCIRRSDILFRYGGEEFVIVLARTELYGAVLLAQRVRAAIERMDPNYGGRVLPTVTVSVGVSMLEADDSAYDLIGKADRALYMAKEQGRNRVVEFAA